MAKNIKEFKKHSPGKTIVLCIWTPNFILIAEHVLLSLLATQKYVTFYVMGTFFYVF
jgi:hypothetical protein